MARGDLDEILTRALPDNRFREHAGARQQVIVRRSVHEYGGSLGKIQIAKHLPVLFIQAY